MADGIGALLNGFGGGSPMGAGGGDPAMLMKMQQLAPMLMQNPEAFAELLADKAAPPTMASGPMQQMAQAQQAGAQPPMQSAQNVPIPGQGGGPDTSKIGEALGQFGQAVQQPQQPNIPVPIAGNAGAGPQVGSAGNNDPAQILALLQSGALQQGGAQVQPSIGALLRQGVL